MSSTHTSNARARKNVLDAAITVICECGYYRASSNAIARKAEVTWGSIQHHFGSREGLMLAVLEDSSERLVADLATAEIFGDTLEARILSMFATVTEFWSTPEYIAILQIMWNLGSDSLTRSQTRERLVAASNRVDFEYRELALKASPLLTPEIAELSRKLSWGLGVNLGTQSITRDYEPIQRRNQHAESLTRLTDTILLAVKSEQASAFDSKPFASSKQGEKHA